VARVDVHHHQTDRDEGADRGERPAAPPGGDLLGVIGGVTGAVEGQRPLVARPNRPHPPARRGVGAGVLVGAPDGGDHEPAPSSASPTEVSPLSPTPVTRGDLVTPPGDLVTPPREVSPPNVPRTLG